jgi:hypothetical protein
MPVYFVREGDRGVAVWRASDEAPDLFLCSVELTAYDSESEVRDNFASLITAVADHFRRQHVVEPPVSRLAGFDCERCESPEAIDLRFHAAQSSGALDLSPSGFPTGCCRVKVVAAFGGRPDAPRPAARR